MVLVPGTPNLLVMKIAAFVGVWLGFRAGQVVPSFAFPVVVLPVKSEKTRCARIRTERTKLHEERWGHLYLDCKPYKP